MRTNDGLVGALVIAVGILASCSSSSGGGTGALGSNGTPYTCASGPLMISATYAEEVAGSGMCDSPPVFLTGKTAAGGTCSDPMTCAPSCCVCPMGTRLSGQQVLISACGGTCARTSDACCSDYLFSICSAGAADAGPG